MKFTNSILLVFLVLILFGGTLVRFYRFDNPIADWHSWRQADTSAVSRNFVANGFDLLHPQFDDISNVPTHGVFDNPKGYRFVEFPLYNAAQAGLFKLFGILTLEEWGRIVSILASVFAGIFLYLLVSRHSNKAIGMFSAFFYMFIPYDIYYGRTILPDTSMAMAILGGIYFFDKWIDKSEKSSVNKNIFFIATILFTAVAFLLKPYAVFFVLPMIVIAYQRWGARLVVKWQLWLFTLFSVLPLIGWRFWIMQYPEGIPDSIWLLNSNGIRFHPAFFRWIFYERLTRLISGYLGVLIFIFGLYRVRFEKEWLFFSSFLLSSFLYIAVFATGNVQHDYYQILIMPSVSIFFAIGAYYLYKWSYNKFPLGKIVLVVCLFCLFWFGWQQVKDYFNINNRSMLSAGAAVDRLTPKNAKVIANLNGDTSLLYQTKRKGWPSFERDVPILHQMGADYLILLNPTKQDMVFGKMYNVLAYTKEYVIFDLRTEIQHQ